MDKYAIIDGTLVINVCFWDGVTTWEPPDGTTLIKLNYGDVVGPGYSYIDGKFIAPPIPDPEINNNTPNII